VLSQVKRVIRGNYSSPPTFGGQAVTTILESPALTALWRTELDVMRERILANRRALVDALATKAPRADFGFVLKQRGMFSYTGLTEEQVNRLRRESSVYAIDTGRICVASLSKRNVGYVAEAIAKVLQ